MKHLLSILFALLLTVAGAQVQPFPQQVDIAAVTDLSAADAGKILSDKHDLAAAKAKYPQWYARWNARGKAVNWTQAKIDQTFMANGVFTAALQNEYFKYAAFDLALMDAAWINMLIPHGNWKTTTTLYCGVGITRGSGSFSDGWGMGSTVISPWHERWNPEPGIPNKRNAMTTWIRGAGGVMDYAESTAVDGIRFEGNKQKLGNDPSFYSSGLVWTQPGECAILHSIKANGFNDYGVELRGGTPGDLRYLSVFHNGKAGLALIGTALKTINIGTLTGDDNRDALFEMLPGEGQQAGGSVFFGAIKSEIGTYPFEGIPRTEGCVGILRGQFGVVIGVLQMASVGGRSKALFIADPRLEDGSPQQSHLLVHNAKAWNVDYAVIDHLNRKMWPMPAAYRNFRLEYWSANGGRVEIDGKEVSAVPLTGGPVNPPPPPVEPPPPPPPPVEPPIIVDPPPTGAPVDFTKLQKGTNGDFQTVTATKIDHNGSPTANRIVNWEVRELSFDITVHALEGYRMILNNNGPDGIYLNPQGYLTDRNGTRLRSTPLVVGQKASVTITYSTPQKFTRIGAIDGQGNCFRAIIENLKYR